MTSTDSASPAKYPQGPNQRSWTAVERRKLKGLMSLKVPPEKIARTLRRPVASVTAMANRLGLKID